MGVTACFGLDRHHTPIDRRLRLVFENSFAGGCGFHSPSRLNSCLSQWPSYQAAKTAILAIYWLHTTNSSQYHYQIHTLSS